MNKPSINKICQQLFSRSSLKIAVFIGAASLVGKAFSAEEKLDPKVVFDNYFKDWYQVEMIIFERIEEGSDDPEEWPKTVSLAYPPNLSFLNEPSEEDENAEETVNQENPEENTNLPDNPENNKAFLEKLKQGDQHDPLNQKIISTIEQSELERLTPKEKPYEFLTQETQQLSREARLLGRDRAMRVLFHNVWRQPIVNLAESSPLVITGGDLFDKNFELEGTMTFHVSRYLHVHTNLWLTQFEANFGQETDYWPRLPIRPEPLVFEEPVLDDSDADPSSDLGDTPVLSEGVNNEPKATPSLSLGTTEEAPSNNWEINLDSTSDSTFNLDKSSAFDLFGNYSEVTEEPFVIKQIVTLKQKRRMRSGELHYIDHPRMGVLVRIDRYEPQFVESAETTSAIQ